MPLFLNSRLSLESVLRVFSRNSQRGRLKSCDFQICIFVGFYSIPNLIVILFNLMYPVFVVGIYCKGCVIVRESVKTQAIKARRVFAGISRLSIPQKDACALHMTGMQRVSTNGDSCVSRECEYLTGKAFPRDILFCQTVLSDTHFLHLHYLYPHYPQMRMRASERKP